MIRLGGRQAVPTAPWEIADEVELYARESGRHGKIVFVPGANTWIVRLSLRSHDPALALVQSGAVDEQWEDVWLHEVNPDAGQVKDGVRETPYKPLDIYQLGAAGVRRFLERGNTLSGRGEFRSVEEAVAKARAQDVDAAQKHRESMKEENRYERREHRRQYQQIPAVTVGIELKQAEGVK